MLGLKQRVSSRSLAQLAFPLMNPQHTIHEAEEDSESLLSDSLLGADANPTPPPARSPPQRVPPVMDPSASSVATMSLYDAHARIAPPRISEPVSGSNTHTTASTKAEMDLTPWPYNNGIYRLQER